MEYRNLGRSGLRVSPLCLGTMNFGGPTDEATAGRMFDRAADAAAAAVDPMEDLQVNAALRRDLVRASVRRALRSAAA